MSSATKLLQKCWLVLALLLCAQFAFAQVSIRDPREYTEATGEDLGTMSEGHGIAPGGPAPDATLVSIEGGQIALSDLWAEQSVMLVFYRGGWCPYCNAQIRDLTVKYESFKERSVLPVLVSVDEPRCFSHVICCIRGAISCDVRFRPGCTRKL